MSSETAFAKLLGCIAANDSDGTQKATFELGAVHNRSKQIPDDIVERILTLLRSERMYKSPLAAHLLNFFEFEAPYLSDRAKSLCIGFLNAHGDQFKNVLSHQVVAELREGRYLRSKTRLKPLANARSRHD